MQPTGEEILEIMASTGLGAELAIGYWQDQRAFDRINTEIEALSQANYRSLSPQGKRYADDLRAELANIRAAAWR